MHPIQKMIDQMNKRAERERAKTQMTVGKMIDFLEGLLPVDETCTGKADTVGGVEGHPMSYRGYYSDLAFAPSSDEMDIDTFLLLCRGCIGHTFTGYKGGDFVMSRDTPLWVADYGNTGRPILGADVEDRKVVLRLGDAD